MISIMIKRITFLFLIVFAYEQFAQTYPYHAQLKSQFEYPVVKVDDSLCLYNDFLLSFNCDKKLANWVAYTLTKSELIRDTRRSNIFKKDPDLRCIQGMDDDYRNSGIDRGHLAPSADFTFSKFSNQHTFFFTNISPQKPEFNRGIWKKLEEETRAMCVFYDSVSVVSGPVFSDKDSLLGVTRLPIPKKYFKVLMVHAGDKSEMAAFLIPNEKSILPFTTYLLSIDSLETLLQMDFFPMMDDAKENKLEASFNLDFWSQHLGEQCGGCRFKLESGDNCNNLIKKEEVFCKVHEIEKGQERKACSESNGDRACKHFTYAKNGKCYTHQKNLAKESESSNDK